jgi:protein-disulfide isomerase
MKQHEGRQGSERFPEPPPRRRDLDTLGLATLAGVVAILMIAFSNMRDIDRLDRSLGERLGKLEGQVAQVASRPSQAAPAQQGPDPNRVYSIKLAANAPIRGPVTAPVTIAEFSDFQ